MKMRKSFATMMMLVLMLSSILPGVRPVSPQTTSAYAPPPPTVIAAVPPPVEPDMVEQSMPIPPAPGNLSPEVEKARARQAIEAVLEKYLRYWGPRYQVAPVEMTVEGEWAHGVAQWRSQARTLKEPIHILAHRLPDGAWQALMPGTEGLYLQWVDAVPEILTPASEKSQLRAQAAEADALRQPQAMPAVPPAVTAMPPGQEGPGESLGLTWQPLYPTPISMQQMAPLGPEDARQASLAQMKLQVDWGHAPLWIGATLGDSIPLYDLSGEITAYLFPVSQGETPAGYLTIAALHLPNPILEFSTEGSTPLYGALDLAERKNYQLTTSQRPLYLGLLTYGYELVGPSTGERLVLDLLTSDTFNVTEEDARVPLRQRIKPEVVQSQSPTYILGYTLISGVPDWDQFWGSYGCWSGCSPTSGVNVIGYWDGHGYDNLITGSNWQGAVNEMRTYMGTWCDGDQGATYISNISPGISNYAQAHGYTFASELWCDGCASSPTYDGYRAEIDGNRPIVVDVIGHSTYGNHTVAGVGYETTGSYMIIHDNWSSTGENVYLQYGSGYSDIYMHPVVPGGGEQVKLWSLANYQGSVVWSGGTGFSNGPNADSYSMKIPGGWSVKTWRGDNRSGEERCWSESVPNLQDHGWQLAIQSIEVFDSNVCSPPSCNPNADQIALFVDANYNGQCVVKDIGDYPNPSSIGLPNDSISSIKVGGNVRAVLCKDDNYGGGCETFTGDDPDLGNNSIGNDQVSSAKVEQRLQPPSVPSLQSPGNGTAFNESQEITLSWSATGDEYYGEVWGGPAGTTPFGWQSGTSKNIGSQWAGYTYSWHVKARNGAGESGWSDTWTFTVKPAAPSNLNAQTASCSAVNLYWNDNSGNEEGYKIYRGGSYAGQMGMNTTSYQDTGLNENTGYSYYVKAFRGSIESDASNTVNVTTPPCAPPQPDLMPSQWGGWQYPVVPSSITGTSVVNTLYAGPPTYIDWGLTNAGNASTGGNTYGDLYIDDTRIGHYDFGDVQAGATWAFFDWGIIVDTPGWHTLKSVVDPDDLIAESDETNNVWEQQFYWETTCGDPCELNNDPSQAMDVAYAETLSGYICPEGDEDFFRFTGTAGDKVVIDIDARVNGSSLDSYVFLFDSNGTTVLAQNDDEASGRLDSHFSHVLPHDGTYYMKVREYDHPNEGGAAYFYTIHLLTDDVNPSAEITSPGHDSWLDPNLQTITTDVSDGESGIRNVTFYWHDANWDGSSDWIVLEDDHDSRDGWTYELDTSSISEQSQDCVVFIYAYDWTGNYAGYGSYHLGLDRTVPTGDILIQGGAEVVTDTQVTLTLNASDTYGVLYMRLRNGSTAWGMWEPYATSRAWTLPARESEYTVGVQFQDPAGNVSAAYFDSVSYQFPYRVYLPLVFRSH